MPYGDRRLVGVESPANPLFFHGFNTDVSEATSTALGHAAVTESNMISVIFGVNSPKPATAKKFFGTPNKGYESSFIDKDFIAPARADGWEIKPRKIATFGNTAYAKVVYVESRISIGSQLTYKFAWRMPLYQFNAITAEERDALGIQTFASAEDDPATLVFGVTNKRNKPNRARKRATVNGRTRVIQTFVAYNKETTKPTGWT